MAERLLDIKQSLLEFDVNLDAKVNENLHDREIRIDNGWVVKIGRGLDFFQKHNLAQPHRRSFWKAFNAV